MPRAIKRSVPLPSAAATPEVVKAVVAASERIDTIHISLETYLDFQALMDIAKALHDYNDRLKERQP